MKPEPRKPMEKIQHRLQRLCQGQAGAGVPPWKAEGPSQERSGDWRHGCFSLGIHETGQLLSQEVSKPALPTHPPHLCLSLLSGTSTLVNGNLRLYSSVGDLRPGHYGQDLLIPPPPPGPAPAPPLGALQPPEFSPPPPPSTAPPPPPLLESPAPNPSQHQSLFQSVNSSHDKGH